MDARVCVCTHNEHKCRSVFDSAAQDVPINRVRSLVRGGRKTESRFILKIWSNDRAAAAAGRLVPPLIKTPMPTLGTAHVRLKHTAPAHSRCLHLSSLREHRCK